MPVHDIRFEFDVGDLVRVRQARDIEARVAAYLRDERGVSYKVIWWQDGHRHCEWLLGWELERV